MLIAGTVILLFIVGMFFQALTMSPKQDAEWQSDTDGETDTTPPSAEKESAPLAA